MKSRSHLLAAGAVVFGLAACESSTAPDAGITQLDANQIANDVDALSFLALTDAGISAFGPVFSISVGEGSPSAAVEAVNRSFSNTHPCPAGGSVSVAGTTTGTSDRVAHNLSITTTATRTDAACAVNTKTGVLTMNGNPNIKLTNSVNIVAGKPSGPQTQSHKGSFKWTRGDKSGTCDVDVTSVFDATAGTHTVTGTMCGRAVTASRSGPKIP